MKRKVFAERLSAALKSKGLKPAGLAAQVRGEVALSTIKSWSSNEPNPTLSSLIAIANVLDVSVGWLAGDDVAMTDPPSKTDDASSTPVAVDTVTIPYYSVRASAGPGSMALEEQHAATFEINRRALRQLGIPTSAVAAMSVHGDSGEPSMSDGDVILVDRGQTHLQDGYLYVIGVDQDVVVKRVERLIDRSILLKSDNPAYQSQRVPPDAVDDLRVIGRVRWAIRYL